jgi:hypothetical protein
MGERKEAIAQLRCATRRGVRILGTQPIAIASKIMSSQLYANKVP